MNIEHSSNVTIENNVLTGMMPLLISYTNTVPIVITGNRITGSPGILNFFNAEIVANVITGGQEGIIVNTGSPKILRNQFIANGLDIRVDGSSPNISYNMYDTIVGAGGIGMYNIKSDGTPAIEP